MITRGQFFGSFEALSSPRIRATASVVLSWRIDRGTPPRNASVVSRGYAFTNQTSECGRIGQRGEDGIARARERYVNELEFTFRQPLLRGAGVEVNTAAVKTARHRDEIAVLALRQTIADVVSSVVRRYRAYGQAERGVDIRSKSLARARELLAVNRLLVRTGRMAARDIVQTRADIAGRELQLIAARNRLDAARVALIDILDIDTGTRLRLTDRLSAGRGTDAALADLVGRDPLRAARVSSRCRARALPSMRPAGRQPPARTARGRINVALMSNRAM